MKIYLHTHDNRYGDRIQFIKDIEKSLREDHGIEFVSNVKHADIIMSQQVGYAPDISFLKENSQKDVIILEVNDTASIFSESLREFIKNPRVKGFFKLTNFKNIEDHNKDVTTVEGRYHANFMDPNELIGKKRKQKIIFKDSELLKIKCALPGHLNFRMDHVRNAINNPGDVTRHERTIDVNFAGTTDYSKNKNYVNRSPDDPMLQLPNVLAYHRKKCLKEALDLRDTFFKKVLLSDHKPMSQPQYWNSLYNSKICLSPWGFGAYNWRDYESMYLGALVIKPDTDFLETYCDIYRSGETYVKCDPDFGNMSKIVLDCLENFSNYERILSFSHMNLRENENLKEISKRFASQLKDCFS